ncbi:MAG: dihydropteroate synthase [Melioribacteraceae bacterium]|nr:dihydropteroate synthase [Melioribacteraceae bacterium]MCF8352886.1 dihydropteroate synthase [Melioribacteraceae bacterium]MCF8417403.1 dihydropteroate synthase [Melioribacteraceae bacterium]
MQIININFEDVFKRYAKIYNVYHQLYEKDLYGLEFRGLTKKQADLVNNLVLASKEICYRKESTQIKSFDILVLGTLGKFKEIAKDIISSGNEDLGMKTSTVISNYSEYDKKYFQIEENKYFLNTCHIMGIVNITPDSFSDGGKYNSTEKAVEHAINLIDDGADIIDIGGESSRPGADAVEAEEEIARVIPVIKEILVQRPGTVISIDTYKSIVAEEAIINGAKIVNDISAFSIDDRILRVVKKHKVPYIIMHMRGTPKNMQDSPHYNDVTSEVYEYLRNRVNIANDHGVNNLIIDPGIGFGKRLNDNFELIKRLEEFKGIGYPILIGLSRKSYLGKSLNLEVDERDIPTLIHETMAAIKGARIIRTHNVKNAVKIKELFNYNMNPETVLNV